MRILIQGGLSIGWEWHNRRRADRGQFVNEMKVERVQFRCTGAQRDAISRRAARLRMSMAEYMLELVRADLLREDGF